MQTLIYSLESTVNIPEVSLNSFQSDLFVWRPGLFRPIPPGKEKKYLIYWVFHYFHIFHNRDYAAILIYKEKRIIASMMIVPSYFKWPFMSKKDVQFTYVMTDPKFRGLGFAERMIKYAIYYFSEEGRNIWYVTDTKNAASINLCTKVGFNLKGYGKRRKIFMIKRLLLSF